MVFLFCLYKYECHSLLLNYAIILGHKGTGQICICVQHSTCLEPVKCKVYNNYLYVLINLKK